jgi:large subunit ribosomal protein L31
MKKNIHPKCYEVSVNCSCGNKFQLFLTLNMISLNVEVCNNCHPFYTGKQKIIDVAGRVDGFYRKFSKFKK